MEDIELGEAGQAMTTSLMDRMFRLCGLRLSSVVEFPCFESYLTTHSHCHAPRSPPVSSHSSRLPLNIPAIFVALILT